ncbi:hypothetical protein RB601_006217 [Gaeumannomyces tritici]
MPPRLPAPRTARLHATAARIARPAAARRLLPPARFRYSTAAAMDKPRPTYSPGSDAAQLDAALAPLLAPSSSSSSSPPPGPGGRWTLTVDGGGLERSFRFKTFAKTWDFMTAVSLQCKIRNHHPEWSNVYNTTFIRWTTHNPKGLSALDVELAAKCDELARQFGEQQQEESPPKSASCNLQDLASTAATSSGNCCGPKK